MDEVSQERVDDAWDEGFAHGYSRGNEEGLKIAFKDGYDFGAKTVSAKFADEIERLQSMIKMQASDISLLRLANSVLRSERNRMKKENRELKGKK